MLSAVWCDYLGQMLTIFLSCLAVIVSTNQVVYKSRDKNLLASCQITEDDILYVLLQQARQVNNPYQRQTDRPRIYIFLRTARSARHLPD